jgi:hypothetical protein
LVLEKNANFFAENWQKTHKFVIITSTPGTILQTGANPTTSAFTTTTLALELATQGTF